VENSTIMAPVPNVIFPGRSSRAGWLGQDFIMALPLTFRALAFSIIANLLDACHHR